VLDAGGRPSIVSTVLNFTHTSGSSFVNLPVASFLLVELYLPPRCFTCTGRFAQFERAAAGAAGLAEHSSAAGRVVSASSPPLLDSVSVDCEHFAELCARLLGDHVEPLGSFVFEEPPLEPEPPEGWASAWPTSTLILGMREELLSATSLVPSLWRIGSFDTAEHILEWVAEMLGSLPAGADVTGNVRGLLPQLRALSAHDFRLLAIESAGLEGITTDHGCVCRRSWTHCEGGFFGHWRSCEEMRHCSARLNMCETATPCWGNESDTCNSDHVSTFPPALGSKETGDAELATALLLHVVLTRVKFSVDGGQNASLSEDGDVRRRALLRFLSVLCVWFPDDRANGGEALLKQAIGGLFVASERVAQPRRLFWWWPWGSTPPVADVQLCRSSLCTLHHLLRDQWDNFTMHTSDPTAVQLDVQRIEDEWRLCGRPWYAWLTETWGRCRGTLSGTRQLPCGLWVMLHAVLARAALAEESLHQNESGDTQIQMSPLFALRAIRSFLMDVLPCPGCANSLDLVPFSSDEIRTYRDAMLWLWSAHNQINRLVFEQSAEARSFGTDPAFRSEKNWPPEWMCAACRSDSVAPTGADQEGSFSARVAGTASFDVATTADLAEEAAKEPRWDHDVVFRFLLAAYGGPKAPEADVDSLPRKVGDPAEVVASAGGGASPGPDIVSHLPQVAAGVLALLVAVALVRCCCRRSAATAAVPSKRAGAKAGGGRPKKKGATDEEDGEVEEKRGLLSPGGRG